MGDTEVRLLALEARIAQLTALVDSQAARLASAEQNQWQATGGAGGVWSATGAVYPATNGGSSIAAKSAGVCSSGTVTLKEINVSTGAVSSGRTVTAWNFWPAAVPASRDVTVGRYVNANGDEMWLVGPVSCT